MADPLADYLGVHHPPAPNARILSLVPSLTELLFDLGLAGNLAGRTHYCIHPKPGIDALPSVGGTKKIKMDRVIELRPTHALVNVDENPREIADALSDMGIDVIVTHPMHPDDNPALYRLIGRIFGSSEMAERLATLYTEARKRLGDAATRPQKRVLYLIWKDPWMAISPDTYIAGTLRLVNWRVTAGSADLPPTDDSARYPELTLSDELLDTVDLVLFSSEPYTFSNADIAAFRDAYPNHAGKAHLIDGEMTSWYGSRAIRGLDYIGQFADRILS